MVNNFISKELFISTIDSLRTQISGDKLNSELIEQIFPGSKVNAYDNSPTIKALILLLQVWFPRDAENGFCEIEHYCFELDFGRWNKNEVVTAENLWDQLIKDFK